MMGDVVRIGRRARSLIGVYYAEVMEYRAEIVLWVLGTALPFILMGVWMTRAAEGGMDVTPVEFARYFFATFVVRNLTLVWVVWEFEWDVVEGRLSHRLLQPIDPGWHYLCNHVAERVMRLPIILGIGIVFFLVYPKALWWPGWSALALGLTAVVATFVMRYMVQYAFAQLAFWTERAHAVEQLWALPYMFLSGMVAPLELYPEAMQTVLLYTPFPYLIWFPARILVGGEVDVAFGLTVTIGWAVVFTLVHRGLWYLGVKRYSAMGA